MKRTNQFLLASLLCSQALMLGGCGSSSSSNDNTTPTTVGLPEELNLVFLNSTTSDYYSFDTSTETSINLNELASTSEDTAVRNLQITDPSTIGHFLHWPDFRMSGDEELLDMKYVLMKPGYAPGSVIDADQFVQLAHFHDEELAAHNAEEFRDPEEGSAKAAGLARLNSFVTEQADLEEEVGEAMPEGQQLCRAYVDPYVKFEMEEEHEGEEAEAEAGEEHEHGELVHYALSKTGRMYFFEDGESGLEQTQGFVTLDDVTTIADCNRTSIARTSEDGVLVFIPDTQKLYLVDSHDADYHQHSTWDLSAVLPTGITADLVAIIGAGDADHDHE